MDFLNHGSFGATPRKVLAAQDRWRLRMERQPLRFFVETLPGALREAAGDLADFIGGEGCDLAFVDNATSGTNAVLRSFPFSPGDEILSTDHSYGAVSRTIEYVARRTGATGVTVAIPFPPPGEDDIVELLAAAITDRTRMVVLDHITSATALILPIRRMVALCRERGVPVLVDGAHAPGMVDLDVSAIGADWYTGNCHKWLCSAKGCAFLWTNPSSEVARRDLHPTVISHFLDAEWPTEFDFVGTRDYTPFLSLTAALDFHRSLGPNRVRTYMHDLVRTAGDHLCAAWGLDSQVPSAMTGSILTLAIPQQLNDSPEDAIALRTTIWERHRIEVPFVPFGGRMWLRISAQVYNELADYKALERIFPI
jgi:isopenicillin-N epimerase